MSLLDQVPDHVQILRVGPKPASRTNAPEARKSSHREQRSKTSNAFRSIAKKLGMPPYELVTETPDQYVGWARQATRKAQELLASKRFDVIYTTGPPHSTHLVGDRLSKQTGLPWIADFRDPWSRYNWPKKRNPWGRKLQPYFERKIVSAASRVVLNNDTSMRDFQEYYANQPPGKFVSIPNGFDPDLVEMIESLHRLRNNNELRSRSTLLNFVPKICHPGTLYRQRTPQKILEALKLLDTQGLPVGFLQIGSYSDECDPHRISRDLGIPHLVESVPRLSHHETIEEMFLSDILVAIQPNAPLQVPGKLYEMLLFDQPILAVCDSAATSEVVASAGLAWSCRSANVHEIASGIKNSLAPVDKQKLSKRIEARLIYDGKHLCENLSETIKSLTQK